MNGKESAELREAQDRVHQSNEQIEDAVNQLKDKTMKVVKLYDKFLLAAKKPPTLFALAFVVGISVGQLTRTVIKRRTS